MKTTQRPYSSDPTLLSRGSGPETTVSLGLKKPSLPAFSSSNRVASLIQYQSDSRMERYDPFVGYSKNQHTLNSSSRSGKGSQRDEWVLPSSRKDYVKNHDATKLAELYSSGKNIAPVWTKVTKTPWNDKAKLCTGYGIAMERTKISADAPGYFLDPHSGFSSKAAQSNHHPRFGKTSFTRTFSKGHKLNEANESSYVLPGGESILAANTRSRESFSRSNYRTFFHDRQTYIDHLTPPRTAPAPPIKWEYSDR